MTGRYSMLIQWSDEDQVFVVTLPEFGGCMTHGDSYEDAAKNGREVLELLIESYEAEGCPFPAPLLFTRADEEESPGVNLEGSVG